MRRARKRAVTTSGSPGVGRGLALSGLVFYAASAHGQPNRSFIPHTSPTPVFASQEGKDYNLKWGKLTGRFHASWQSEYNDNINLASNGSSDFIFSPNFGVGFIWPMNKDNLMQVDVGMGYRWYVSHSELNAVTITPDTSWHYQLNLRDDLRLQLHDNFHTVIDPVERPELSGLPGKTTNFKRYSNNAGFQLTYQLTQHTALSAGYDYMFDRSFNSDFKYLDRDDHTFSAGAFYELNSRLVMGITAAYTITEYQEHVQNDGASFTISPVITYKPSQFITVDASIGYTISEFDQTGTVMDRSDFSGLTWQIGARHTINSRMSHNVRFSKSISPGLGSNFSELTALQYAFLWKMNSWIGLNGTFAYEDLSGSAGGDKAQRFLTYIGSNFKLSRHWAFGLSYGFAWKDSDLPGRDYVQNRVTIDVTRNF